MDPIRIDPKRALDDAMRAQQKLAASFRTLREVEDVDYGATRREEVWRDGKVVLYRYRGDARPTAKVPLLISYALVNRPYMVDLQADRSLVKGLLARGQDVYVLDWGYPDRSDRFLMLEDYIERFSAPHAPSYRSRAASPGGHRPARPTPPDGPAHLASSRVCHPRP